MPILHNGSITCERCGKEFAWIHFELSRVRVDSSVIPVETIPEGQPMVHSWYEDGARYYAAVNCPHCNFDNFFDGSV